MSIDDLVDLSNIWNWKLFKFSLLHVKLEIVDELFYLSLPFTYSMHIFSGCQGEKLGKRCEEYSSQLDFYSSGISKVWVQKFLNGIHCDQAKLRYLRSRISMWS